MRNRMSVEHEALKIPESVTGAFEALACFPALLKLSSRFLDSAADTGRGEAEVRLPAMVDPVTAGLVGGRGGL